MTTHTRTRNWLEDYLDYTSGLYTSNKFNLAMGLVALSAATQGRCRLERGHLTLYPNLWCLLVAPPGSGKGNSITVMHEVIREAGVNNFLGTLTTASIFDALVDSKISSLDRCDGPTERMPLLLLAPEASAFFQADEHRKGIIGQLTDLYDQSHNPCYEKKLADRTKSITLVRPYLSFVGAATGDSLLDAIPAWAIEHGFMSRLLAVWSDYPAPVVPQHDAIRMVRQRSQLSNHLKWIKESDKYFSGVFKWSGDALSYYNEREFAERQALLTMDTKLRAYKARRGTFLLKIAMLVSLAKRDSMFIFIEDLQEADRILGVLDEGTEAIYSLYGNSELYSDSMKTLAVIKRRGTVLESKLKTELFPILKYPNKMAEALQWLEQTGAVTKDGLIYRPTAQ